MRDGAQHFVSLLFPVIVVGPAAIDCLLDKGHLSVREDMGHRSRSRSRSRTRSHSHAAYHPPPYLEHHNSHQHHHTAHHEHHRGRSHSYHPGEDPQLRQWFNAVDSDRSGTLSVTELQNALVNGTVIPGGRLRLRFD